jgi:P4 family phage/plasmid primase-like protien
MENITINKMENTNEKKHPKVEKMYGTDWYIGGHEPLHTMIADAKEKNYTCLVARDYFFKNSQTKTKVFGAYKNTKHFSQNYFKIAPENKCFYTIVPANTECCLFADIEWSLKYASIENIKERFIVVVTKILSTLSILVEPEEFLFVSASRIETDKGSLHLHIPTIKFNNIVEQKRMFNAVYLELEKDETNWFITETAKNYSVNTFIDFVVYNNNREIRIPYSGKMNEDGICVRPLMPDNEENFDLSQWMITNTDECLSNCVDVSKFPSEFSCTKKQMWNKTLIQEICDEQDLDVTVETLKGKNLILLKNKRGGRTCPINGEKNTGDNAYLTISGNKITYYCHDEGCKGQSKIIYKADGDDKQIRSDAVHSAVKGTHYHMATLFVLLYAKDNIRVVNPTTIYHWNSNKCLWELELATCMMSIIHDILEPEFLKIGNEILVRLKSVNDKAEESMHNQRLKKIQACMLALKSVPFLKNVIQYIISLPYDKDFETKIINKIPYELPIKKNKIINFKTLVVRNRTKKDFWSVECPVSYNPECDLTVVETFMDSITCHSKALKDYHRRLWGYLMTGEISDRSLHILYGNGCNGKSSIVNISKSIMGNLFNVSLSEDVMTDSKVATKGASPEMMDLLHGRCGVLPESDKDEKLNSKKVKAITGDDTIKARHLYGSLVEFKPQTKCIWATNNKPKIDTTDEAIIDRIKTVPFKGRFLKNQANTDYIVDLRENHVDEFFFWFCSGAYDWYNGAELVPTIEMTDEMNDYIAEFDTIGEFIEDTLDIVTLKTYSELEKSLKVKHRMKKVSIWALFTQWRNENKKESIGKKVFHSGIAKKIKMMKQKDGVYYLCKQKSYFVADESDESDDENNENNLPNM